MSRTDTTEAFARRRTVSANPSIVETLSNGEAKPSVVVNDGQRDPYRLIGWHELPKWLQEDNLCLETGYRAIEPSFWSCLNSWTYLHNESSSY